MLQLESLLNIYPCLVLNPEGIGCYVLVLCMTYSSPICPTLVCVQLNSTALGLVNVNCPRANRVDERAAYVVCLKPVVLMYSSYHGPKVSWAIVMQCGHNTRINAG